jgi:uncharacterized protein YndB with AHSA1/START domain
MDTQQLVEPVRRTIVVECSVEHAFETFTAGIGSWWPLHTHSIGVMSDGTGTPAGVVLEPRANGKIAEIAADGTEKSWGEVLVAEPPHRLVMRWQPGSKYPTEVEVRFEAVGDATRVELEHRDWEIYADEAPEARNGYANGWPGVLARYAEAAGSISR